VLKRFLNNPILKPKRENDWESRLVLNPAVIQYNGLFHLLYRAVGEDNISRIGYALSDNGFDFFRLDKPVFTPRGIEESKGCEDPRVVQIEGRIYMTYTSYSTKGIHISLASTSNFLSWQRYGVIMPDIDNKDAVLFPEKINDRYVMFHRPMNSKVRSIWIAYSDDLIKWCDSRKVISPIEGSWDCAGIGSASPPVKTEKGWLLIYHGVDQDAVYRLGVVLFDLNDPSLLITRYPKPIFEPKEDYELHGEAREVVFGTGICEVADEYYIYYGAADKVVCGARIKKSKLLELL